MNPLRIPVTEQVRCVPTQDLQPNQGLDSIGVPQAEAISEQSNLEAFLGQVTTIKAPPFPAELPIPNKTFLPGESPRNQGLAGATSEDGAPFICCSMASFIIGTTAITYPMM